MKDKRWQKLMSLENLHSAWLAARKGKRHRPEVRAFEFDLESALIDLQQALRSGSYRPGAYRQFKLYDRKPRFICAAPFRDRVLHHALMQVVSPRLEAALAPHCYACRPGLGTHRAVAHYQRAAKRYAYVLKLDIASYFPCIDHGILQQQLVELFPEKEIQALFAGLIDSSPRPEYAPLWVGADLVDAMQRRNGLPIGNLTSQHLANLYLNPVDQWLEREPRVGRWLRYVDDIFVFADNKDVLWALRDALQVQLNALRLCIHSRKCELYRCADGVEVLGYRVTPSNIRLRRDNGYRYRRRLRGLSRVLARGEIDFDDVSSSVAAWLGHTGQANAKGLQSAVLSSVCFKWGERL